jgi:hypothetical protein
LQTGDWAFAARDVGLGPWWRAVVAAAFDPSVPLAAMHDAGLEIGAASVGLLFVRSSASPVPLPRSAAWIAAGATGFLLFIATLGRGAV